MRKVALAAGGLVALLCAAGLAGWLYLRAPDLAEADLVAKYGRPNSRRVDLPGGVRLHYLDSGAPGAPAVLLVHGFGDNSFSWDGWTQRLAHTHRVIAVDLPGHGLTASGLDFPASPDRYADLLDTFAAKIGLKQVAVAGNSMGGAVAWQLAVRHPARVSRLILVDAAGWPSETLKNPPLAFRLMRYKLGRDLIASIDNMPLIRAGLKKDVVDQSVLTEAFVQRWADLQRFPGHRPILMSLRPGNVAASKPVLSAIKVPTLVMWGAEDQIIEVAAAHKFADAIAGAKLVIYPHVGHLPQYEAADRSARDAEAFLAPAAETR